MTTYHVFGPVLDPALLQRVAGADCRLEPIRISGFGFSGNARDGNPALRQIGSLKTDGYAVTVRGEQADADLRYWMTVHGWTTAEVEVLSGEQSLKTAAYANWQHDGEVIAWPAHDWQKRWTPIWNAAVSEIIDFRTRKMAAEVTPMLPAIWTRAQSLVNARSVRRKSISTFDERDVDVLDAQRPYSNFFAVQEYQLSHRRFDGSQSPELNRAVFVTADASTVLPYDPVRDRVLLVEQFRPGVFARGDAVPWVLEPVAGRIDSGDTPEETARREAVEEAGIELQKMHHIASYYSTPGGMSEYLFSYIGEVDLPDDVIRIGGLASEGEDIKTHLMQRSDMMALISDGTIVNGPLLLSAFWLQANLALFQSVG